MARMRLPSIVALAVALVPATAVADTPQVALVSGSGALATFDVVSADGCTHTFGELALVETLLGSGELADGLYVVGMQEDLCYGGFGNGFAGFTEADGGVLGLLFGSVDASLVAPSYSGGADVAIDVDLTWLGHGPVTRDGGVFHDDSQISFQYSRRRNAATLGTLSIDGVAATVTSATLISEVSGQVTF